MRCDYVRHIIDQVRDREIPESSLCDIIEHIEICSQCCEYLEDSLALSNLFSACNYEKDCDANEFFLKLEEVVGHEDQKPMSVGEMLTNRSVRFGMISIFSIIILVAGFWTHYTFISANKSSMADQKVKASLKHIPEGAVLMKSSDGREVMFVEPAIDDKETIDQIMRELEAALTDRLPLHSDGFSFASE